MNKLPSGFALLTHRVAPVVILAGLAACHAEDATSAPPATTRTTAATAAVTTSTTPAPRAAAPAATAVAEANDFEDQFDSPPTGPSDPAAVTSAPVGYKSYENSRFGFHVDVPTFLKAEPEATSGDGQQWHLGSLVAMTASAMNGGGDGASCSKSTHVTFHRESKTSCFATGKLNGFIHWERKVVANGVLYAVHLQYAESVKAAMDPVVTRVSSSWSVGAGGAGAGPNPAFQ